MFVIKYNKYLRRYIDEAGALAVKLNAQSAKLKG